MDPRIGRRRLVLLFALFSTAYLLSYFFRSANAIIAPELAGEFGLSAAQLGFMTSLFFGAYALSQVPIGVGLDSWGPRVATPALMVLGAAGCLMFAVAESYGALAVARVLIGIGMGSIILGALKAFGTWFPPKRFASLSGALFSLGSLGALVAATPLAWLSEAIGWRGVFGWGALVVVASAAAIWLVTPALPARAAADAAGADTASEDGSLRSLWRLLPLAFLFVGTTLSFQTLWAGPYLFDVVGFDEIRAGNTLFALSLGVTLGYALSGWTADRVGLWNATAGSCAVFIVAQLGLAATPAAAWILPLYFVFGLAGGFCILPLSNARRITPPAMTGRSVALINTFGIGGAFVLQWAVGVAVDAAGPGGGVGPSGHAVGLFVTAAALLVALVPYLSIRQRLEMGR